MDEMAVSSPLYFLLAKGRLLLFMVELCRWSSL